LEKATGSSVGCESAERRLPLWEGDRKISGKEGRLCRREEQAGARPVQGWSSSGQRVMGQRELQPLTNAVDKKGQQGAPRHGGGCSQQRRAFHMLGTKQLTSSSPPTIPNEKAYAGQQDRGTEAGTMGPCEANS